MTKNLKSKGSRKKAFAMKVSALLATTALALTPLHASASLLGGNQGGLLGGVTGAVGGVVGTATGVVGGVVGTATGVVGGVLDTTTGLVGGVVSNPVGTVGAVLNDPVGTVSGVVEGIVPGDGINIELPVGNIELLNPGVDVNLLSGKDNGDAGTSGLANVGVGLTHTLSSSVAKVDPSTKSLVLDYSIGGLVNVDLLKDHKIVFKMPEEFKALLAKDSFKQGLSASYDYPTLKVLGIDVLKTLGLNLGGQGTIPSSAITVDPATQTIAMNVKGLLSVDALSGDKASTLKVQLTVPMTELPCALDNQYTFGAFASESFIDVALLETYSASVNVAVDYGANNPCVKDDDKKPADKDDDKTTEGPKVDNNSNTPGGKLPITATNLGNMALVGLLTLLAGLAVKFLGRKTV